MVDAPVAGARGRGRDRPRRREAAADDPARRRPLASARPRAIAVASPARCRSPARPRTRIRSQSWSGWGDPAQVARAARRGGRAAPRRPRGGTARPARGEISAVSTACVPAARTRRSGDCGRGRRRARRGSITRHGSATRAASRRPTCCCCAAGALAAGPGRRARARAPTTRCSSSCARARERRIAVVPFGGGTSVVGGVEPDAAGFAGLVALDLRRMNALVVARRGFADRQLEPGLRGPQAEALLGERGYTIGHFPQSFEYATLGGFAAARSSGQASAGLRPLRRRRGVDAGGHAGGRAAARAGAQVGRGAGPAPARARLRGRLRGVHRAVRAGAPDAGALGLRRLAVRLVRRGDRGPERACPGRPAADRAATLRRGRDGAQPRPAGRARDGLGRVPGDRRVRGRCRGGRGPGGRAASSRLAAGGGEPAQGAGEAWARDRFRGPYLRDAMLDAGAIVETLETVTFWSRSASCTRP